MLQEDKQILWRASAVTLGMALPAVMLGKSVMYGLLVLGIMAGLMATKGESLRQTMTMLINSRVTLLVIVWMGALLPGVFLGIDPQYAAFQWMQMVMFLLAAGLLFLALREMPGRHLETLLKVLAIATLSAGTLGLVDALVHEPRLSALLHGQGMSRSPYRLNYVSSVLAIVLPFVWARLMIKAREGEPFAMRIAPWAMAASFMMVMICGGRAGWIAMFAAILVFLGTASRYHGLVIHKRHWVAALGLAVASLALYAYAFGLEFMLDRTSVVGEQDLGRGMMSGRLEIWAKAWEAFVHAPLVGIGVMNYRNLPGAIDPHPHNIVLEMLLDGGLLTGAASVALLGFIFYRFAGYAKGGLYGVAALASLTAFTISSMAHSSVFHGWWMSFLVFIALLGWRAGWSGVDLKRRRRTSTIVKSLTGF